MSNNLPDEEPRVKVGILTAPRITAVLHGRYTDRLGRIYSGEITVRETADGLLASSVDVEPFAVLELVTDAPDSSFEIKDVVIGVDFHWERREDQSFLGDLTFLREHGRLTAVNTVPVEDYLASVISSEMSARAGDALLRAHAVISRSWLMAQILGRDADPVPQPVQSDDERIRWYDRNDHEAFHVCADDHCQRYQGTGRQTTPAVARAIEATRGQVLLYDGRLCDARFSKCCGGVFEEFQNCWEPVPHHYLGVRRDTPREDDYPDLRQELHARRWIMSAPEAFCNTADADILRQVLNNYDRETPDFYRWTVRYSGAELASLIRRRSGIDFGAIRALVPLERGTSGRIVRLRIEGSLRTMVIGKELEIRRTLSPSHLYSSAFVVETAHPDAEGYPDSFTLRGAGWGHGVGLCQIGAAVMGARGYAYEDILRHYFIDAEIKKLY